MILIDRLYRYVATKTVANIYCGVSKQTKVMIRSKFPGSTSQQLQQESDQAGRLLAYVTKTRSLPSLAAHMKSELIVLVSLLGLQSTYLLAAVAAFQNSIRI